MIFHETDIYFEYYEKKQVIIFDKNKKLLFLQAIKI